MRLATPLLPIVALLVCFAGARADGPGNSGRRDVDGNPYRGGTNLPREETPSVAPRSGPGPTIYDDQGAFLAAAGSVTTETFEDEPWTAGCDGGALPLITVDDFTATSSPAALKILREACFGNHNTTPGGLRYLGADTDLGDVSADVMFVFGGLLNAFGLYVVDLDTAVLEITINGVAYPVPPHGDGGQSYFGIVGGTPFSIVTFRVADGTDSHYSFDDVAYAFGGPVSVEARSWGRTKADYRK